MVEKKTMIRDAIPESILSSMSEDRVRSMVSLMGEAYDLYKSHDIPDPDVYAMLRNLAATYNMCNKESDVPTLRSKFLERNFGIVLLDSTDYRWSSYKLGEILGYVLDVWEFKCAVETGDTESINYWRPAAVAAVTKARAMKPEIDTCELQYCSRSELVNRYNDMMDDIEKYVKAINKVTTI